MGARGEGFLSPRKHTSINITYAFLPPMSNEPEDLEPGDDSVRISMLIEKQLLGGIDSAAGRFGLTRSAFIRQALGKALREIGEEPDWENIIESTKNPFYYDLTGLAKRIHHVGFISPEGLRM